jgi:hypothetical protein
MKQKCDGLSSKEKLLIERFINGEKQFFKQISSLKPDESAHGRYLTALMSDDMPATLAAKKEVVAGIVAPDKKLKPSFVSRKASS